MNPELRDIEIVRVKVEEENKSALLALRPQLMKEFYEVYPNRVDAVLTENEDGSWTDIWAWADRADFEDAMNDLSRFPAFLKWGELAEVESLVWSRRMDA